MTANDIERFFFSKVKEGPLGQEIGGRVYRSEMRPDGSRAEDIVVKFISGMDGQEQTGVVIVNVYVPDVIHDGRMVADDARIGELESLAVDLPGTMNGELLYVWSESTPYAVNVEEIKQHAVTVRLNFKLITD